MHSIPHFHQPVLQLTRQLSCQFEKLIVVHDGLMSSIAQDVLKCIPNGEAYTFYPLSNFYLFFSSWESLPQKPFDLDCSSLDIPTNEGCLPSEFADFLGEQLRLNSEFESGRIFNTSRLIEGKFIDLLEKLHKTTSAQDIKQFVLGPFNPVEVTKDKEVNHHTCLEWLNQQETDSVIYISFGTTSSMTDDELKELAIGLERSKQKFIWVLRDIDRDGLVLPPGFEDRVRTQGLVVREWLPQLEILAHRSTGGFMTHCGWGSCMESISMGVPMATWPMHSDQPKNSVLITQVLKVGLLARNWANRGERVSSQMVENVVTKLMARKEGEEVRIRAKELGQRVRESSVAKGGESRLQMEAFIAQITRS